MSIKRSQLTPEIPNRNWLINGDMRVSQRGNFTSVSAASHNTYYIDRMKSFLIGVTADKQHISSSQPPALSGSKSLRMTATSTASGRLGIFQIPEDYELFKDKIVTVSAWVKSNSTNARISYYGGSYVAASETHSGNGQWERLSGTVDLSGITTLELAFWVASSTGTSIPISHTDENGSGQAAYIEVTGIKLEISSIATNFVPRSYAEELTLCQRYYEKSYDQGVFPGAVSQWGGTHYSNLGTFLPPNLQYFTAVKYRVEKRANPTITLWSFNGTSGQVSYFDGGSNLGTATAGLGTTKNTFRVQNTSGGAYALPRIHFHWVADAEI